MLRKSDVTTTHPRRPLSSVSYLKVFGVSLGILIIASLLLRIVNLYQESSFKDEVFTIMIRDEKYSSNSLHILHIDKRKSSISHVILNTEGKIKEKFSSSYRASLTLGIPIDAIIVSKSPIQGNNLINDFFSYKNLYSLITLTSVKLYGLNSLDLITTFLLVNYFGYEKESYNKKTWENGKLSESLYEVFQDEKVINEKISVEIINSSSVNGVGSKLAALFRIIGYNVVSVSSGNKKSEMIYRIKENYSLRRLKKILPLSTRFKDEVGIADVTIIVDESFVKKYF